MGVEDNKFSISNLASNTSFYDWFLKENEEIINKLNRIKLYDVDVSGSSLQGVSAQVGTTASGITAGFIQLGVEESIPHGVTLTGKLTVSSDATVGGDLTVTGKVTGATFGTAINNGFDFTHSTTALTAGVSAGFFAIPDNTGGITLSSGLAGSTAHGFDKNNSIGVVESITNNTFRIVTSGLYNGFSGLTSGQAYYLDPDRPGGFTLGKTLTDEQTVLKLFVATSTTEGIVQIGDPTVN